MTKGTLVSTSLHAEIRATVERSLVIPSTSPALLEKLEQVGAPSVPRAPLRGDGYYNDVASWTGDPWHVVHEGLQDENEARLLSFVDSMVRASIAINKRPFLTEHLLRAFNLHAIAGLHEQAGDYRTCEMDCGHYTDPPPAHLVPELMRALVDDVAIMWDAIDAVSLATLVWWRIFAVQAFINGNKRTATASCHFVLCTRIGFSLPGRPSIAERISDQQFACQLAIDRALASSNHGGPPDLSLLHRLITQQIEEQIATV